MIFFINFLLAISTTIGMTIIPILCTESLGFSLFLLGILEGTTEFLSNVFRITNGIIFDRIKNKRILFVLSTGLSFLSKTMLFLPSPWSIFFSKTSERISNGAFATPRDAYVGEAFEKKGQAMGWLSASKSFGCVLGPAIVGITTLYLGSINENISLFVVCCCILTAVAFFMSFFLKGNNKDIVVKCEKFSFSQLTPTIKAVSPILALTLIFFLGRFNDGVLMLFLKSKGFPEWFYLSTISIFNLMIIFSSPFMGYWIDRGKSTAVFLITFSGMILFCLFFIFIDISLWLMGVSGLLLWGVQRTGAQIIFTSTILKMIPKKNYGTAIGLFYITSGFGTLVASMICGKMAGTNYKYAFMWTLFFSSLSLLSLWRGMKSFKISRKSPEATGDLSTLVTSPKDF
jgi:MFS family permease